MNPQLIEALTTRALALRERIATLQPELHALREELRDIDALLRIYQPSTTPPPRLVCTTSKPLRHSPGEAERAIDMVLRHGQSFSIAGLSREIQRTDGRAFPDVTIGLALKRHEGRKYQRHGKLWSRREQKAQGEETGIPQAV